ncbi:hypothetical protein EV182_006577, partial [Spiromyces aspiralis]
RTDLSQVLQFYTTNNLNELNTLPPSLQTSEGIMQFNKMLLDLYPQLVASANQTSMAKPLYSAASGAPMAPQTPKSNEGSPQYGLNLNMLHQIVAGPLKYSDPYLMPVHMPSSCAEHTTLIPSPQPSLVTDHTNSSPLVVDDHVIGSGSGAGSHSQLPKVSATSAPSAQIKASKSVSALGDDADVKVYEQLLSQLNAISSQPATLADISSTIQSSQQQPMVHYPIVTPLQQQPPPPLS